MSACNFKVTSRENGWEVVSLTSSAYAAATIDDWGHTFQDNEAMFMSGHFVFPPSQHENLPVEHENVDDRNIQEVGESFSRLDLEEEQNVYDRGMHEKNEINERTTLEGVDFIEKEQIMTSASKFDFIHSETTLGGSDKYDKDTAIPGQTEPQEDLLDSDILKSLNKIGEDGAFNDSGLPCNAWWKRGAASRSFWSIFDAAAMMDLVVLGRQFHGETLEVLHQKWKFAFDGKKLKRSFGLISRFKIYIESGRHKGSGV